MFTNVLKMIINTNISAMKQLCTMLAHRRLKMISIVSFMLSFVTISESTWANDLGGMLSRSCMYGFGISGIRSQFDEHYKDRQWEINCTKISQFDGDDICMWTYDFVNEVGNRVKFSCKNNEYISGLYADYNATATDRIWRVECCNNPGIKLVNCADTDWLNKYGYPVELHLLPKRAFHGFVSVFKSEQSDRKWKFTVCDVRKDDKNGESNEPNIA